MRAGTLREYIELHRPVPPLTPDPAWGTAAPRPAQEIIPDPEPIDPGEPSGTLHAEEGYQHYATTRASVVPIDATEQRTEGGLQTIATHRVTLRYRRNVRSTHRVLWWDGMRPDAPRRFEIVSVIDPGNRHRELVLLCKELPEVQDE